MVHVDKEPTGISPQRRDRQLSMEYLRVMRVQESTRYGACTDVSNESRLHDYEHEEWRRQICQWCYEVVDHYDLNREVVSIALHYMDRFVMVNATSGGKAVSGKEFQLLAITALYVAVKLHGETDSGLRKVFPISSFVNLAGGRFDRQDIEDMEGRILHTLDWRLNPPTPARFVVSLKHLFPSELLEGAQRIVVDSIFDMALFFTELSVCSSDFSISFKPSIVAFASILCSMDSHKDSTAIPQDLRTEFLKRVALSISLLPDTSQVQRARALFVELWDDVTPLELPSGLKSEDSTITSSDRGSSSPVCVRAERQKAYASQRKRGRPDE